MQKFDFQRTSEIVTLLADLTENEGDEVRIHHDNQTSGGADSAITVIERFGPDMGGMRKRYFGDSVFDCLSLAKAERIGRGAMKKSVLRTAFKELASVWSYHAPLVEIEPAWRRILGKVYDAGLKAKSHEGGMNDTTGTEG